MPLLPLGQVAPISWTGIQECSPPWGKLPLHIPLQQHQLQPTQLWACAFLLSNWQLKVLLPLCLLAAGVEKSACSLQCSILRGHWLLQSL